MSNQKKEYEFFAKYIYEHTGIFIPETNYFQLENRFNKLKTILEVDTLTELYLIYNNNPSENNHLALIDLATNNETTFFREEKSFEFLVNSYLAPLIKNDSKQVKIWSCACSSGQEVYSIVMKMFDSHLSKKFENNQVEIKGSDIDGQILQKAEQGIYSTLEVQRGLRVQQLIKFFDEWEGTRFKINDNIKDKVSFFNFNLLHDEYQTNYYDVVLCRNVLIYQKIEDREKVINNIYQALKPEGILMIGSGESLLGIKHSFTQKNYDGYIYYQKRKESL